MMVAKGDPYKEREIMITCAVRPCDVLVTEMKLTVIQTAESSV